MLWQTILQNLCKNVFILIFQHSNSRITHLVKRSNIWCDSQKKDRFAQKPTNFEFGQQERTSQKKVNGHKYMTHKAQAIKAVNDMNFESL